MYQSAGIARLVASQIAALTCADVERDHVGGVSSGSRRPAVGGGSRDIVDN
jgi:hypothetical protein